MLNTMSVYLLLRDPDYDCFQVFHFIYINFTWKQPLIPNNSPSHFSFNVYEVSGKHTNKKHP